MPYRRLRLAICAAFLACTPLQAAPLLAAEDTLAAARGTFEEWIEVLGIPNDAAVPADIQRNTTWFERAFQRRGFDAQQLPNEGKPMLFAEAPNPKPTNVTVLFYAHLDGQPVTPSEWQQESPWKPVLKQRGAGGAWEPLPIEALSGATLDPEWRLFARSSADDKAPIVMLLAAIDALRAQGQEPAINIKVLLDSEEEKGSPSLDAVIRENMQLLESDVLLVLDGPMHPSNLPTLVW